MYHIGIDLGGTNIAVGIVNENNEIICKGSVPTGRHRASGEIIRDMADLCKKLICEANLNDADIKTIGMGYPGSVDIEKKKLLYASNFMDFGEIAIEEELKQHFPDAEIHVENDANAAAYGEMLAGAAKGEKDVLMITLGTGIGGGIIIDGKIYSGFNYAGGELGHTVIFADGEPCTCGRRGCWESYASVTALVRETKEEIKKYPDSIIHEMIVQNEGKISGRTAFDAMRAGDAAGKAIVEQYIRYIGIGVTDMINIFQPKKVVIGGGISKEGETLLKPLREYVASYVYTAPTKELAQTEIVAAKLGNDAGIIGAAKLFEQSI